ncbi:ladderlectin-like [Engraulis encrasicolus]|uniref:ladderlectin-like n=1 Tax=Engraulis encrasicolus TaxID=184585 RepID=UPI002FD3A1FB
MFPYYRNMKSMMAVILLLCMGFMCSVSGVVIQSENITNDSPFSEGLVVRSQSSTNASSCSGGSLPTLPCPDGWEQYGERCYKFISTARSWAEAERFCVLLGGNLASVHSIAEYHYIQGLIVTATHGAPLTWLGGTDAQQESIWLWSDGSRLTFLHWHPGQPDNYRGVEHCLQINFGGGLLWSDLVCSTLLPSVCARNLD